jgi:hypothetical protein
MGRTPVAKLDGLRLGLVATTLLMIAASAGRHYQLKF